jgi:hypothetical protein
MKSILVGIDAGSKTTGVVSVLNGSLAKGWNTEDVVHEVAVGYISGFIKFGISPDKILVVYEDIRPYTNKFSLDTIQTLKLIGAMEYRLFAMNVECVGIPRSTIKYWVFERYKEMATERINKEIIRLDKKNDDGQYKKASFHYVNDRIVAEAMRLHYKVPPAKVGKSNMYGLSKHSWQALAALTAYLHPLPKKEYNEKD